MGLLDFQVILDNPVKVFFAGQPVSGRVLVNVSEPKKMKCLKVEMVGRGEVHWDESETRSVTVDGETRNETVSHRNCHQIDHLAIGANSTALTI